MKTLNLLAVFASAVFVLSSCSTSETLTPEEQSLNLLKSYTIQRDASGTYSLDFDLNSNAQVDKVRDVQTNTDEIYLYSSTNESSRKMSQDLYLNQNQIKVGFVDANSDKKQATITVLDHDIKMNKGNIERLETFGLTGNDDGSYDLDFKVKAGVAAEFVFDGDRNVYEVHLQDNAKATQSEFLQTFTKENGVALNIEFVNNASTTNARAAAIRRPVVIIMD
jgi:hypothetical protein